MDHPTWPHPIRPDTFDATAIREIYVEDVYRAEDWMNGGRVLDLGANVGVFSVWAAQLGAVKVLSVEACKENYDLLARHTEQFPVVQPMHAAVGPYDGHCRPIYLGDDLAHMSFVPGAEARGPVSMLSLDSIVSYHTYNFVKVDIEGMEWEIFDTASDVTMKLMRHIAIEFHGTDCPGAAPQPEGAFGRLVTKLSQTHCVHTLGAAEKGGMIYADVY